MVYFFYQNAGNCYRPTHCGLVAYRPYRCTIYSDMVILQHSAGYRIRRIGAIYDRIITVIHGQPDLDIGSTLHYLHHFTAEFDLFPFKVIRRPGKLFICNTGFVSLDFVKLSV